MRWHSVYCLPSIGEPFGMTVLEAMACGLPVVGTRAGGIPDLLSAQGGRLVPPRDPVALATALIEVLRSPDLQRTMGRHNRARVEEAFDIERTVDRLEAVYESILTPTSVTSSERSSRAQEEAC
jgi:glycosyltransferase involved in cell wall biosynthesis